MLCADSESSIEDVIFERRFGCAEGFCRLGAQAETAGRVLTIAPGGLLRGTVVEAPDLRGGAALVLAGLAAGEPRSSPTRRISTGAMPDLQRFWPVWGRKFGGNRPRETGRRKKPL